MEDFHRRKRRRYREIDRERFRLANEPPPAPENSSALAQYLPRLLKDLKLEDALWDQQLLDQWCGLVGPQVAGHARPGKVERKTLIVYVTSSAWLQELNRFGRAEILAKVQQAFGAERIRDVRLVLDPDLGR